MICPYLCTSYLWPKGAPRLLMKASPKAASLASSEAEAEAEAEAGAEDEAEVPMSM